MPLVVAGYNNKAVFDVGEALEIIVLDVDSGQSLELEVTPEQLTALLEFHASLGDRPAAGSDVRAHGNGDASLLGRGASEDPTWEAGSGEDAPSAPVVRPELLAAVVAGAEVARGAGRDRDLGVAAPPHRDAADYTEAGFMPDARRPAPRRRDVHVPSVPDEPVSAGTRLRPVGRK